MFKRLIGFGQANTPQDTQISKSPLPSAQLVEPEPPKAPSLYPSAEEFIQSLGGDRIKEMEDNFGPVVGEGPLIENNLMIRCIKTDSPKQLADIAGRFQKPALRHLGYPLVERAELIASTIEVTPENVLDIHFFRKHPA